jgi:hypothetical protein
MTAKVTNVSGTVACATMAGTADIAIGAATTAIAAVLSDTNPQGCQGLSRWDWATSTA